MADNYIERQQEQYEARKAAWKQAQKYGKKKLTAVRPAESKSHTSTVSKPEDSKRRVFITGGAEGIGKGSPVHALLAQRAQDRLRRHAFIARHLKVPDKK